MIEEVVGACLKSVGRERPAVDGDGDAELVFFVSLTMERHETGIGGLRVREQGAGNAGERWWLVEMAVKAAENPVQVGDFHRHADAGKEIVFTDGGGEIRVA